MLLLTIRVNLYILKWNIILIKMMKILKVLFILMLSFKIIITTCESDDNYDPLASSSSCPKRTFDENEIDDNAYKCCYFHSTCPDVDLDGQKEGTNHCAPVTKIDYDQIDEAIKIAKGLGCTDVKISCISSYLKLSLIYLILMLI